MLHGDFGRSFTYRVPVSDLIAERLPVSLPLAVLALLFSTVAAFPVGFLSAARRGRMSDAVLNGLTQLGLAIPNFWLECCVVMLFAVRLHWVSAGGFPGWDAGFFAGLKALALPALALAMPQAAILARVLRGSLIRLCSGTTFAPRAPRAPANGRYCGITHCPMRWCRC